MELARGAVEDQGAGAVAQVSGEPALTHVLAEEMPGRIVVRAVPQKMTFKTVPVGKDQLLAYVPAGFLSVETGQWDPRLETGSSAHTGERHRFLGAPPDQ
ncbi:hypothetical protein D3C84_800310 [compost metagenome]